MERILKEMASNDENTKTPLNLPISLIPFAIQLQNVVPIEIVAKRYPVNIVPESPVNIEASILDISVAPEDRQAQIITEITVIPTARPKPFEIVLQVVGAFTYPEKYNLNELHEYLESGGMGAMIPFLRELILDLSMRLQIPPIMLPVIQLQLAESASTEKD